MSTTTTTTTYATGCPCGSRVDGDNIIVERDSNCAACRRPAHRISVSYPLRRTDCLAGVDMGLVGSDLFRLFEQFPVR